MTRTFATSRVLVAASNVGLLASRRVGLTALALALGCSSTSGPAPLPIASASASAPRPSYALPAKRSLGVESALDILLERGISSWTAVDVASLRASPVADRLARSLPYSDELRRADIVALDDLDRALLVTHPSLTLVEHHVDDARVERFLTEAGGRGSEPLQKVNGRTCARLEVWPMGVGTACALAPGLLVVTNEADAALLDRLAAASLPPPPESEVAHTEVLDSRVVGDTPFGAETSLGPGQVVVDVRPDRALRVHARFTSERAAEDQRRLSKSLAFVRELRVTSSEGEVRLFLLMTP